jgi:hypothetical protein
LFLLFIRIVDGGKVKPLKQAKGAEKVELDEDKAFKEKQKAEAKALKEAAAKLKK